MESYFIKCISADGSSFSPDRHPEDLASQLVELLEIEEDLKVAPLNSEWGAKVWKFEFREIPPGGITKAMKEKKYKVEVGDLSFVCSISSPEEEALAVSNREILQAIMDTSIDNEQDLLELIQIELGNLDIQLYFDPEGSQGAGQTNILFSCDAEGAAILEKAAIELADTFVRFKRLTATVEYRGTGPVSGKVTADKFMRNLELKLSKPVVSSARVKLVKTEPFGDSDRWVLSYHPDKLTRAFPAQLKFSDEAFTLVQQEPPPPPHDAKESQQDKTTATDVLELTKMSHRKAEPIVAPHVEPQLGQKLDADEGPDKYAMEIEALEESRNDLVRVKTQIAQGSTFAVLELQLLNYHFFSEYKKLFLSSKGIDAGDSKYPPIETSESIEATLAHVRQNCISKEMLSTLFQDLFNDLCKGWDAFKEMDSKFAEFIRWGAAIPADAVQLQYKALSEKCKKCVDALQKVDFLKLTSLRDHVNAGILDLEGKDVLVFIGNSGVGKTTLTCKVFGARFVIEDPKVDPPHLIPVFDDDEVRLRLESFKSGKSVHSITKSINAIQLPPELCGGRVIYLLDTPGLDDTRSLELAIANSINMVRVLGNCNSVRPVIVLSKADLGNRLMEDGVKKTFYSIHDILRSDQDVKKFTYVFTKYDEARGINLLFEQGKAELKGGDMALFPLWSDIAAKTKVETLIANKDSLREPLLASMCNDSSRVLHDPRNALSSCVARYVREALVDQLCIYKESIAALLARTRDHHPEFIKYQLTQLRDVAKEFIELPEVEACYSSCIEMVANKVNQSYKVLEDLKTQMKFTDSRMSYLCEQLIAIKQLAPVLSGFSSLQQTQIELGSEKACSLFLGYFEILSDYFKSSGYNRDVLVHAKDTIRQMKALLSDLLYHGDNLHAVDSVADFRATASLSSALHRQVLCIWDPVHAKSIAAVRDLAQFSLNSPSRGSKLSVWCVPSYKSSEFLIGRAGGVRGDSNSGLGSAIVDACSFEAVSKGIFDTNTSSVLSGNGSVGELPSSAVLESSLDGVILQTANLLLALHDFLQGTKMTLTKQFESARGLKDYVATANCLGDIKYFSETFKLSFDAVVDEDWYNDSVACFSFDLSSVKDNVQKLLKSSVSDDYSNLRQIVDDLHAVCKRDAVALVEKHVGSSTFTTLVGDIALMLSKFVKGVYGEVKSYDMSALTESATRTAARYRCHVLQVVAGFPKEFQELDMDRNFSSQILFDEAMNHITAYFNQCRSDLFWEVQKLTRHEPNYGESDFGQSDLIISLMKVLCEPDSLYFDKKSYLDAAHEAERIISFYKSIVCNERSPLKDDIRVIGKGLAAVKCMAEVLTMASHVSGDSKIDTEPIGGTKIAFDVQMDIEARLLGKMALLKEIKVYYSELGVECESLSDCLNRRDAFSKKEKMYFDFVTGCHAVHWCLNEEAKTFSLEQNAEIIVSGGVADITKGTLKESLKDITERRDNHLRAVWSTLTSKHDYFSLDKNWFQSLLATNRILTEGCNYLYVVLSYFKLFAQAEGVGMGDTKGSGSESNMYNIVLSLITKLSEEVENYLKDDNSNVNLLERVRSISGCFQSFDECCTLVHPFSDSHRKVNDRLGALRTDYDMFIQQYDFENAAALYKTFPNDENLSKHKEKLKLAIREIIDFNLNPSRPLCRNLWHVLSVLNSALYFTKDILDFAPSRGFVLKRIPSSDLNLNLVVKTRLDEMKKALSEMISNLARYSLPNLEELLQQFTALRNGFSTDWKTCCSGSSDFPICFGCSHPLKTEEGVPLSDGGVKVSCPSCRLSQIVKLNDFVDPYFEALGSAIQTVFWSLDSRMKGIKSSLDIALNQYSYESDDDSDDDELDSSFAQDEERSQITDVYSDQTNGVAKLINELYDLSRDKRLTTVYCFSAQWVDVSAHAKGEIKKVVKSFSLVKDVFGAQDGELVEETTVGTNICLDRLQEQSKMLKKLHGNLSAGARSELFDEECEKARKEGSRAIRLAIKEMKKQLHTKDMNRLLLLLGHVAQDKKPFIEERLSSVNDDILKSLSSCEVRMNNSNALVVVLNDLIRNAKAMTKYNARKGNSPGFMNSLCVFLIGLRDNIVRQVPKIATSGFLVAVNSCYRVLVKVLGLGDLLNEALARSDTFTEVDFKALATSCGAILDNANQLCVDMCRSLNSSLNQIEQIVPPLGDNRLVSSHPADLGLIVRVKTDMDYLDEIDSLIDYFQKNHANSDLAIEALNKYREGAETRIGNLVTRGKLFCENKLDNPKMKTPNISDKRSFLTLFQFCIMFIRTFSSFDTTTLYDRLESEFDKCYQSCLKQLHDFVNVLRGYKLSTAAAKPDTKVFTEFNGSQQVLEVATEVFAEGLRDFVVVKRTDVISNYERTVEKLVALAYLTDTEWKSWNDQIGMVSRVIVMLGKVSECVTITEKVDLVSEKTATLLDQYYNRSGGTSEGREIGAQFIASVRRGVKMLDPDCELLRLEYFEQHANADRNAQFDKVPPEKVVGQMVCSDRDFNSDEVLRLYAQFLSSFNTVVDNCKDKAFRSRIREIPVQARMTANAIKSCKDGVTVRDKILELVVLAFAYWTLSEKSLECFDRTPAKDKNKKYLWLPNAVQVIAVIRLLGLDYPQNLLPPTTKTRPALREDPVGWFKSYCFPTSPPPMQFANHLSQVLTGEGKSIVLAVLGTILALLGFDVDVVCYSDELTSRDSAAFTFLFRDFGVLRVLGDTGTDGGPYGRVYYATFKQICNNILNGRGNIAEKFEKVIESKVITNRAVSTGAARAVATPKHRVLLIDEVDVLFSDDFFGRSYDLLAQLKASNNVAIKNLFVHIWTKYKNCDRNHMLEVWNEVKGSAPYQACLASLGDWSFFVEFSTKLMLFDLTNFDETYRDKYVDIHPVKGIRYLDNDNVPVYNQRDSYCTLFELMRINELDKTRVSDALVLANMDILVKAGSFSYAEIPRMYSVKLGVSGTLALTSAELSEYSFTRTTKMPTSYPPYKPPEGSAGGVETSPTFEGSFGDELLAPDDKNTHFDKVIEEIRLRRGEERPILVFFKDDRALSDFQSNPKFVSTFGNIAQVISALVDPVSRERVIKKTAKAGNITLASAVYGRGTDFYYDDPRVDRLGGVHVIITFFPSEKSDLVQLFGRTRRQGHPGSRSLVLSEADFANGGIDPGNVPTTRRGDCALWRIMEHTRDERSAESFANRKQAVMDLLKEHKLSEKAIGHLFDGNIMKLKEVLLDWNQVMVSLRGVASRTVIMIDATGSMQPLLIKCRRTIKEILRRIYEILGVDSNGGSNFAIQIVIYRNYNADKVVETSAWLSDGSLLNDFIDKVQIDGGYGEDGREAIEMGFAHVNSEIAQGRRPTQILVVGDFGPNDKDAVKKYRLRETRSGLKGEAYWSSLGPIYEQPTDWEKELNSMQPHRIPVHAYYLKNKWATSHFGEYPARPYFEKFKERTNGSCAELDIEGDGDNADLIGILATKVLSDVDKSRPAAPGGQSLAEQYVQKFGKFKGYVRGT